jgi:hypothetical protein
MKDRIWRTFRSSRSGGVALGALLSMVGVAAAAPGYHAEIAGVKVAKPPYQGKHELSVFGSMRGGAEVAVLVAGGGRKIIGFDGDATGKTLHTNDIRTGGALAAHQGPAKVWPFVSLAKDGSAAVVKIKYAKLPAKGVRALRIRGNVVVRTAAGQRAAPVATVPLTVGTQFHLGPAAVTIARAGKARWGGNGFEVALKSDSKIEQLSEIKFFDAAGHEIQSSRSGTSRIRFNGAVQQVQVTYRLHQKVAKVTVRARYWTDVRAVAVPLNLTAPIGL